MMRKRKENKSRIWRNLFIAFIAIAVAGFGISMLMFMGWSKFQSVTFAQATLSMDSEIAGIDDRRPYLTIAEDGTVAVDRDLQQTESHKLAALHMLAYEPAGSRLVRVRFPFWFVKVKTTNQLNLGTLVSALSSDWDNLDLKVTEDDLAQRGPGLVLDHTRADGGRIILWSE